MCNTFEQGYVFLVCEKRDHRSVGIENIFHMDKNKAKKRNKHAPLSFSTLVFQAVKKIPSGQTRTYKQIAGEIGRPNSCRAVGNALNRNYDPSIPCHRVVRSDGKIGGYNRGQKEKFRRLKRECAIIVQC